MMGSGHLCSSWLKDVIFGRVPGWVQHTVCPHKPITPEFMWSLLCPGAEPAAWHGGRRPCRQVQLFQLSSSQLARETLLPLQQKAPCLESVRLGFSTTLLLLIRVSVAGHLCLGVKAHLLLNISKATIKTA